MLFEITIYELHPPVYGVTQTNILRSLSYRCSARNGYHDVFPPFHLEPCGLPISPEWPERTYFVHADSRLLLKSYRLFRERFTGSNANVAARVARATYFLDVPTRVGILPMSGQIWPAINQCKRRRESTTVAESHWLLGLSYGHNDGLCG